MKVLLVKKIEMSQVFDKAGAVHPVTFLRALPSAEAIPITVSSFQEGDAVSVSSLSKGKGFQGVVKRHGFHGGPRTHGQKHSEREPGSIGAVWPQRVLKGTRMAGRMGGGRITVRNLKVMKIFPDENLIAIKGAVPGRRGSLVEVREQTKN